MHWLTSRSDKRLENWCDCGPVIGSWLGSLKCTNKWLSWSGVESGHYCGTNTASSGEEEVSDRSSSGTAPWKRTSPDTRVTGKRCMICSNQWMTFDAVLAAPGSLLHWQLQCSPLLNASVSSAPTSLNCTLPSIICNFNYFNFTKITMTSSPRFWDSRQVLGLINCSCRTCLWNRPCVE